MTLDYTLDQLFSYIDNTLGPEVTKLIQDMNYSPGEGSSPFLILPSSDDVDLHPEEVARLIAKTANQHARACRLAGLARAQYKICEGRYKQKFKTALSQGKNESERQALAAQAAKAEHDRMIFVESIVELCESIETAARISSESARRMLLGADQMFKAENKFERYRSEDETPDVFKSFKTY